MKVFVTGGTGFVGKEVVSQLLNRGYQVRLLCHSAHRNPAENLELAPGDTTDPSTLAKTISGCDAIIHLVGIIREFPAPGITFERLHVESTKNMLVAAREQGVRRFIHMSANGARADAQTNYHKTKWRAEEAVRDSELEWTIFRPSLIYGPNDQFINMLARLIKFLPVVPVMGDGQYRLQPVAVADVAAGIVASLEHRESSGQTYHCGGPTAYSYDEILELIGQSLGKTAVKKLHQPLWLMKPLVSLLQSIPQFPMTSDQLQMLLEGNCCDPDTWQNTFDLDLTGFAEGISGFLNQ